MTPRRFYIILLATLGFIIVGTGAGYYLALQAFQSKINTYSKRLADIQLKGDQLESLQGLSRQYQQVEPLIKNIDMALPKTKEQSELAVQLQNIANGSGMIISNLTFLTNTTLPTATSQTVKQGDLLTIPVNFTLSGSYDQLQSFLQRQERLGRYTSVSSLSINRGATGSLSFTISLNAFVKP